MSTISQELAYLPLADVADQVRQRRLSPVELTQAMLSRISRLDGRVNAYYTVFEEQALADARAAEAEIASGIYRGPLHGIPLAVKDIVALGPTTAGSRLRKDYVAEAPAAVVSKLKDAGAIILGKLATYEFALGTPTLASYQPPARNPWDLNVDPGGSSSGSGAAVAAGLAFGAIGTDTGGSIRWPAFCCGIAGIKPTYGRVSRRGVFPLSWNLDHIGPMARTVLDCALMLQACAGYDPLDGGSADEPVPSYTEGIEDGIAELRIGVPWGLFQESCDPAILALFENAVERMRGLGAEIASVESLRIHELTAAHWPIMVTDATAYHLADLQQRPEEYSRTFRLYMAAGALVEATTYLQAQRVREQIRGHMLQQLGSVDLFMTPTVGMMPGPIRAEPLGLDFMLSDNVPFYPGLFNLTGFPAMSVPCGFTEAGLPVGFQIAAAPFAEALVFRAGHAYERSQPWWQRHPPL
jgi:aspartyl-tRNA(Asn)/glutamyl-tRNA(Gln) amidotransferase subunit A